MAADGEDSAGQGEARAGRGSADRDAQLRRNRLRAMALAAEIGGTVLGSMAICLGGGILLDRQLGTKPLFLLIGLVLAFIAIGYALYQAATVGTRRRTRGQARTVATRTGRPVHTPEPSDVGDRQPD
jgi:ATP synthase protein I